jgi:hypothetical protein
MATILVLKDTVESLAKYFSFFVYCDVATKYIITSGNPTNKFAFVTEILGSRIISKKLLMFK